MKGKWFSNRNKGKQVYYYKDLCHFIGCNNRSVGSTMKQVFVNGNGNYYADIPTCADGNHWLILRKIWDLDILEMLFNFKLKRLKYD